MEAVAIKKSINMFTKTHTINVWSKIILKKFNYIPFSNRENHIADIFNVTSKSEIAKIKKASLIAFGKTLGIETFEDACKKLGKVFPIPQLDVEYDKKLIAQYKLIIIIKVLNEGWYPNWQDSNERKYYPYFNMTDGGFSYWNTGYHTTHTDVPSALYLKSEDLVLYCVLKFIDLYKDLYE
jgi:hypothetical protein